jgi:SAM-dependent methyltransferase
VNTPRTAPPRPKSRGLAVGADRAAPSGRHVVDSLVLDQVRVAAWDRLLFVECGDGWMVEEAWRRMGKGRVCGLSTSPQMVELAAQLRGIPGRIEFEPWGGERFPLPDQSFDGVISCVPLVRYRQPSVVLHEMARVLRPDGAVYLFEAEPPVATVAPVVPVDLSGMLMRAGLMQVGWGRCETAPRAPEDHATPVVIHARRCPAGARV